jgi:hypothetical protein
MPARKTASRRMHGAGFFGDLLTGLKPLAGNLARQGLNAGINYGLGQIGLGMKRRKSGAAHLVRGSAAAKARMAIVRSHIGKRRSAGSFVSSGY